METRLEPEIFANVIAADPTAWRNVGRIAIVSPGGNVTAVLFGKPEGDLSELNAQIMQTWQQKRPKAPPIEQCCYVTQPCAADAFARVDMFGGEFCGNALRSAAWLLSNGQAMHRRIEISGASRPLRCWAKDNEAGAEMPLPQDKPHTQSVAEGQLVQLDGITQLVVLRPKPTRTPRQLLENLLAGNKYGLAEQPAVGVSYYDYASSKAEFCVWVRGVNTIFDETACGSGTCAISIADAMQTKSPLPQTLNVVQPSGVVIRATAQYVGRTVQSAEIAGEISLLYDEMLGAA